MPALPSLSAARVVADEDVAAYRRDGHVLLREVASAEEVNAFREVIVRAATDLNDETRPLSDRDLYGRAFLQTMNLWRSSDDVAAFVLSQRFGGIAARLLGVERVRVYHDQALFKEGGGGITPWHQDAGYWPLDGTRCVTMWLPLQDSTPEMGTLQFASGSNTGSRSDKVISDESEAELGRLVESEYTVSPPVSLAVGDATFHGGWTIHRAFPNGTDRMRAVMTVIWFADGERVLPEPLSAPQQADLARWLPGCVPGGPAASGLNPVVG
jgi:ectoine hydroxylase-related dioxygenase (phytanoyl-CoA dioxygenase family)